MTGTTVVTRESPWDEVSRALALSLTEYEESFCRCGCGLQAAEAHDSTKAFLVDTFTCHARKAIEQVSRKARDQAKAAKRPDSWSDGLHYYAVPLDPEELDSHAS